MFTTHGDSSLKAASMAVASLLTRPSTFLDFPPISMLRLMKRFFTRTFKTQIKSHQNIKLLKSRLQFPLKGNEIELNEISCNVSRVRLTAFLFFCVLFFPRSVIAQVEMVVYKASHKAGYSSITAQRDVEWRVEVANLSSAREVSTEKQRRRKTWHINGKRKEANFSSSGIHKIPSSLFPNQIRNDKISGSKIIKNEKNKYANVSKHKKERKILKIKGR